MVVRRRVPSTRSPAHIFFFLAGATETEFAAFAGISQPWVSLVLTGRERAPEHFKRSLAEFLGVDESVLFPDGDVENWGVVARDVLLSAAPFATPLSSVGVGKRSRPVTRTQGVLPEGGSREGRPAVGHPAPTHQGVN